jgi:hypothetical protein
LVVGRSSLAEDLAANFSDQTVKDQTVKDPFPQQTEDDLSQLNRLGLANRQDIEICRRIAEGH